MRKEVQFPLKVEEALKKLDDCVYAEISKAVANRGPADSIANLTGFLRDVQSLRRLSERNGGLTSGGRAQQAELGLQLPLEVQEFSRNGDFLVRRGKRQNGTDYYEQRIPWEAVRRLAENIDVEYGNRSFHPSGLSRHLDVPAYQVYAVLRLFTSLHHIESPRRGTYRRLRGVTLLGTLDSIQASLPVVVSPTDQSDVVLEAKSDED
jgi:hypothetical protein